MKRLAVLVPVGLVLVVAVIWIAFVRLGTHAANPVHNGPRAFVYIVPVGTPGTNSFEFSPATTTVKVGTKVIWFNRTESRQSVTGTGTPPAFDSGVIGTRTQRARGEWSYIFQNPGTYDYHGLHAQMKGTVVAHS